MLNNKKSAFTLAEIIICILIIGVLAALTIPVLLHNNVQKNKQLFRKSYTRLNSIIYEVINDSTLYNEEQFKGFAFSASLTDEEKENIKETRLNGKSIGEYFCENIAGRLNTIGDVKCTVADAQTGEINSQEFETATPNFVTTDGVEWFFSLNDFDVISDTDDDIVKQHEEPDCPISADDHKQYTCIRLDVNGKGDDNPPNTGILQPIDIGKNDKFNIDYDRFVIYIYSDGTIQASTFGGHSPAQDILSSDKISR